MFLNYPEFVFISLCCLQLTGQEHLQFVVYCSVLRYLIVYGLICYWEGLWVDTSLACSNCGILYTLVVYVSVVVHVIILTLLVSVD